MGFILPQIWCGAQAGATASDLCRRFGVPGKSLSQGIDYRAESPLTSRHQSGTNR
jgi:hypothetical protein